MNSKIYTIILVSIASLGGLLYGYDLGIISSALLYLDKCVKLSEAEVGMLASAIMIGALASSVIGGGLSDLLGRKKTLILSAFLFVVSVAIIVTSKGFWPLFFGRTLQGLSAGMIAVVVPVFMTECVPARIRGLSSTMFQLCITLGIAISMIAGALYQSGHWHLCGIYFSGCHVEPSGFERGRCRPYRRVVGGGEFHHHDFRSSVS
ncbi:MAG: MFS transporter [Verrucomicrobiota bacterium]